MSNRATIMLKPLPGCLCVEPLEAYFRNKGALSAESTAKELGRMLCTDAGCSRLHDVAFVSPAGGAS